MHTGIRYSIRYTAAKAKKKNKLIKFGVSKYKYNNNIFNCRWTSPGGSGYNACT